MIDDNEICENISMRAPPRLAPLIPVKDEAEKKLGLIAIRFPMYADVFDELKALLKAQDSRRPNITFYPQLLRLQQEVYRTYNQVEHMPFKDVLEGGFLIHDLQSNSARNIRCKWYEEYQNWADRDQVAAAYVLSALKAENSQSTIAKTDPIKLGLDNDLTISSRKHDILLPSKWIHALLLDRMYHFKQSSLIARLKLFEYNG